MHRNPVLNLLWWVKKDQILMAFGPDLLVNRWNKPFSISSSLPLHFCSIQSMTGPYFYTAFSHCWRWNWLCIAHCKLSDDTQHCKLHIWTRIGKAKICLENNVKMKFFRANIFHILWKIPCKDFDIPRQKSHLTFTVCG